MIIEVIVKYGEYKYIENDNTIYFACLNKDFQWINIKIPITYKIDNLINYDGKLYKVINGQELINHITKYFLID